MNDSLDCYNLTSYIFIYLFCWCCFSSYFLELSIFLQLLHSVYFDNCLLLLNSASICIFIPHTCCHVLAARTPFLLSEILLLGVILRELNIVYFVTVFIDKFKLSIWSVASRLLFILLSYRSSLLRTALVVAPVTWKNEMM